MGRGQGVTPKGENLIHIEEGVGKVSSAANVSMFEVIVSVPWVPLLASRLIGVDSVFGDECV